MKKNSSLQKLLKYCEEKEILATVQKLTFGYERVLLDFTNDRDGFWQMCRWLDKKKTLHYETSCPYSPIHFIGYIKVMPAKERDQWMTLCRQDSDRIDDWWRRYHAADEETRRLMACGAIS